MKVNARVLLSAAAIFCLGLFFGGPKTVFAYQEIKEVKVVSLYMDECFGFMKQMLRHAREMQEQARPFMSKRHRARYRFQPNDSHARDIMALNRKMFSRLKMLNGVVYHSSIPSREMLYKEVIDCKESISVFTKRSIRAVKDNNYALFLASAQGIEKEIFTLKDILNTYESEINESIYEADSVKESL